MIKGRKWRRFLKKCKSFSRSHSAKYYLRGLLRQLLWRNRRTSKETEGSRQLPLTIRSFNNSILPGELSVPCMALKTLNSFNLSTFWMPCQGDGLRFRSTACPSIHRRIKNLYKGIFFKKKKKIVIYSLGIWSVEK